MAKVKSLILFHCEDCGVAVCEYDDDWNTEVRDLCGKCFCEEGQAWLEREVNIWLRAPKEKANDPRTN